MATTGRCRPIAVRGAANWNTRDVSETRAVLAVVGAATLFGTTGTALAEAPAGFDPLSAGVLRLLVGGAGLVFVSRRSLSTLRGHRATLLLGSVAVAVYQLGFFSATRATGVAVATLTTIGIAPVASRLIGASRRRPAPPASWYVAATVVLTGLVLLVTFGSTGIELDLGGVFAALAAGVAYAAYTEVAATLIGRGAQPTSAMAGIFFGAGLVTSPLLAWRGVDLLGTGRGIAVLAYLGLVTLTVSYVAFGWGLRHLPPSTVVMLTMVEPVVASILAATVLSERLAVIGWIGAGLVVLGMPIVAQSVRGTEGTVEP